MTLSNQTSRCICKCIRISILLPGIWDTVFNILVTFRDIDSFGKLIMGIFTNLYGILACLLQGIWDIGYPLYKPPYCWHEQIIRHGNISFSPEYERKPVLAYVTMSAPFPITPFPSKVLTNTIVGDLSFTGNFASFNSPQIKNLIIPLK